MLCFNPLMARDQKFLTPHKKAKNKNLISVPIGTFIVLSTIFDVQKKIMQKFR